MPMPWSLTEISTSARPRRRVADRDPGPGRAVGDGVVDQVDQRGDQLGLVAADGQPALPPDTTTMPADSAASRVRSTRLGHARRRRRHRSRAGSGSAPCSRDSSISSADQPAQPGALVLHPAGEPADRLWVVGGVLHRLGQQGQRADRGLQLVRDVGDEVAADRLQPAGLGHVVDSSRRHAYPAGLDQQRRRPLTAIALPAEPGRRVGDLAVPARRWRAARASGAGPAATRPPRTTPICRAAGLASTTSSAGSSTTTAVPRLLRAPGGPARRGRRRPGTGRRGRAGDADRAR